MTIERAKLTDADFIAVFRVASDICIHHHETLAIPLFPIGKLKVDDHAAERFDNAFTFALEAFQRNRRLHGAKAPGEP